MRSKVEIKFFLYGETIEIIRLFGFLFMESSET